MIVKRIDPASAAKICGVIYAAIGFIIGILVALVSSTGLGGMLGGGFGMAAIIVLPILYGFGAAVVAFVGALIYNVAARKVGGVQLDVE